MAREPASLASETDSANPLMRLRLFREPLTARRAARIIIAVTIVVTALGGVLIWLVDRHEYPDLGTSMWWALQTVTTVGYGDVVPAQTGGRVIGVFLMMQGIGTITVVAAAVTAGLIEAGRKRSHEADDPVMAAQLDRIESRLTAIERTLAEAGTSDPRSGQETGDG
jgi:voltage-gated potassium channel